MKIKFASRASFAWTNVILVAVLLTITAALLGQTFYGSIVGTVTDATGAAAPGSGVTLINLGTSERRTAEPMRWGTISSSILFPDPIASTFREWDSSG